MKYLVVIVVIISAVGCGKNNLNDCYELPQLTSPSSNPVKGHYGDPEIK